MVPIKEMFSRTNKRNVFSLTHFYDLIFEPFRKCSLVSSVKLSSVLNLWTYQPQVSPNNKMLYNEDVTHQS